VSRVCARVHTSKVAVVASRWQRMEDLIGSGYETHTSRTISERLTACAIWPVYSNLNKSFEEN